MATFYPFKRKVSPKLRIITELTKFNTEFFSKYLPFRVRNVFICVKHINHIKNNQMHYTINK